MQVINMNKEEWDSRFHIVDSRDNRKVHEFFRQYFDKPQRNKQVRICFPESPSKFYPNLNSTLEKISHRMPKIRRLGVKDKEGKEKAWNHNFQVKNSKDNSCFYTTYREYFDAPKEFDHNKSVVSTIPATAHGYKRSPIRLRSADGRNMWTEVYSPISENNFVKYKALRKYF